MSISFVGGCHVSGFPYSSENGFASIAATLLGLGNDEFTVQELIHLGHAAKVIAKFSDQLPDTLVLQMGHFETSRGFSVLRKPRSLAPTQTPPRPASSTYPVRLQPMTPKWEVLNVIKLQLSVLLGTRYFDPVAFRARLHVFCETIAGLPIRQVVLLSPLPCADRVFLRNRLAVMEAYRLEAERFGFVYLDAMNPLLSAAIGRDIFSDPFHLSLKGHLVLGQLIAEHLTKQRGVLA